MLKGGQNRSSRRTWIPDDFVETINQSWDYRSPVFLQKKKKRFNGSTYYRADFPLLAVRHILTYTQSKRRSGTIWRER